MANYYGSAESDVIVVAESTSDDVILGNSDYPAEWSFPRDNNILIAGSGNDTIRGGHGHDLITGGAGNDTIMGFGDGYAPSYAAYLAMAALDYSDLIDGGAGDDKIDGGGGNDTLLGGTGQDVIQGGAGNDLMYGGAGDDWLRGGVGGDRMWGGEGSDLFVFNFSREGADNGVGPGQRDVIEDFNLAEDKLDFYGYASLEDVRDFQMSETARGLLFELEYAGSEREIELVGLRLSDADSIVLI
ncbi:calcium-binding protein [Teichococcus vastitatis]|uniref:Hemolysin type calcium-binding protein n=1 Tax=Teichococcus vastitatis TaxID=2307076 RepID=A0ABS9W8C4_9PROT|nr:calcium-binding protein [Pseudoroseomonas vastitatis]MCI0755477.1 hypothetical protein [Pseudoroseomonas vastitatis]